MAEKAGEGEFDRVKNEEVLHTVGKKGISYIH
jgi:hypothetical protein